MVKPKGTPFKIPRPVGISYRRNTPGFITQSWYGRGRRGTWRRTGNISIARATDNLDLDAPFICKPSGQPPIMSVVKVNERWFFRLKPGTDFYDAGWSTAFKQGLSTGYGLALASDGTYIWGTRASEVWRMSIPGALQIPPAVGSGIGNSITISQGGILKVQETVRDQSASELFIELDNSKGEYADLPTDEINNGSQVRLKYGYKGKGQNLLNPGQVYFLEDWSYIRDTNKSSVVFYCIDAWGLLENFAIPAPADINLSVNQYTAYELIELLIQCIGGTLCYRSRSSDITALYPNLSIRAGESAADVLRSLLELVPDVIIFDGLTGIIINPQETDEHVYAYHFPNQK